MLTFVEHPLTESNTKQLQGAYMTNSNTNRIVLLVDRSGSMELIHQSIINGLNEFVAELKTQPGNTTVKLCQFDDQYEVVWDRPLNQVPTLTLKDCVPRNGTALYDAIGRTIEEVGLELKNQPEAERPGRVVLMTFTDGLNNSSRDFTQAQVAEMINIQRHTYNWNCLLVGANMDAIQIGARLSIPRGSTLTYAANAVGTMNALRAASKYVTRSMQVRPGAAAYFDAEFTEQDRSAAMINVDAQGQISVDAQSGLQGQATQTQAAQAPAQAEKVTA